MFSHLLVTLVLTAFSASSVVLAETREMSLVSFDKETMNAALELPSENPGIIALLLPGSGNVGLNGDVSSIFVGSGYQGAETNLSEQLAQALAAQGIASFRYAKRGFDNPNELPHQTFPYLLQDAQFAIARIKDMYPNAKVVIVGFSEGALLGVHLAAQDEVDGLFLLSLPTRSIDQIFDYQFVEWPVELLRNRMDRNFDGKIDQAEQAQVSSVILPFANLPLASADLDQNGEISITNELGPFYQSVYISLRGLLATDAFRGWYEALRALPEFSTVAQQVNENVWMYAGSHDPQANALWNLADSRLFSGLRAVRVFEGAGHAFAPLEGDIGQIKTSGPFSQDLLNQLVVDVISVNQDSK